MCTRIVLCAHIVLTVDVAAVSGTSSVRLPSGVRSFASHLFRVCIEVTRAECQVRALCCKV